MKFSSLRGLALALLSGTAAPFTSTAAATTPDLTVETKSLTLTFHVGEDGRLYQRPLGGANVKSKLQRDDECYPQAGDGYIWEPALQVTHADGNTSTALVYDGLVQTNESADIGLTRIHLHDPAYPFEVGLCFRAHRNHDVLEQWTEIRHQEPGPVTLKQIASSALLLSTNVCLTHFFGDWAKEMLAPITEPITPGTKILDSKIGVRASQFQNPNFILALNDKATENDGTVLAGSLAWSGSFQCAFDNDGHGIRAVCGVNPFESAYSLKPGEPFTTSVTGLKTTSNIKTVALGFGRSPSFGIQFGYTPPEVLVLRSMLSA